MRQRDRKKMVDRQSIANIHIGRFIAELNQALEEAYQRLEDAHGAAGNEAAREGGSQGNAERQAGGA
jgi:hypothetical protein